MESKDEKGKDKDKRSPVLMPERMQLAEQWRQDWVVNAEHGVTVEDCKQPEYWAHVAQLMRPYDHIEVRAEDGSWIADFVVLGCDRNWVRVHLKAEFKLTTADVAITQASKHKVEWKGPQHKFAVIRTSDSEMVSKGYDSKEAAALWMREHEKVTG